MDPGSPQNPLVFPPAPLGVTPRPVEVVIDLDGYGSEVEIWEDDASPLDPGGSGL